ncbi:MULTISPECIES: hypothetical protein [Kocuria]|uniref:hypothetical protein n=1 Tax=Kocuria TaxID=57493 RepID=UPI0006602BA7|nr:MULTISPECIES: hypothetical protein [Kocuria]RUQ21673.1 hypothetical protein D8M21_05080 [Kocuria sp. HSID16901]
MNYRVFLTPAYLTSLLVILLGAILVTAHLGVLGWILLLAGLALNVVASMVSHNREELRKADQLESGSPAAKPWSQEGRTRDTSRS